MGYHHEIPERTTTRTHHTLDGQLANDTHELDQVDDGHLALLVVLQLGALLLVDQRPQLVQIDGRAEVVVAVQMEVAHTQLAEVAGMVLVHVDAMVVHATGVTATTGMLTVLSCMSEERKEYNK